jgi:mannose-6-phosphate isomerase-like protein (cupin superfamily)
MSNRAKYARYVFRGRSGYIVDPGSPKTTQNPVAIGHTALVAPWSDPGAHSHKNAEEYYFLLQGELRVLIAETLVSLKPKEILMIRPQVPHAIVGGEGRVEHLGIRAPSDQDKQHVGDIPKELPPMSDERERELRRAWGCRIPLEASRNQNCWLIGMGTARFQSLHLVLAFLDFPTAEAANAGIGTRHRPHLHQTSWEYYAVLKGTKTLQIENELVELNAGEILEVPPMVCHALHSRQAPYEGFTLRVPIDSHDKVECPASSVLSLERRL